MANLAEKLLNVLDAATGGKPAPPDPQAFPKRIMEKVGFTVSADELAALRTAQTEWQNCGKAIAGFTDQEAKKGWLAHSREITSAIRTGTHDKFDGWTFDDWRQDFDQKLESAKMAQAQVACECWPLAKKISDRFVDGATGLAAKIECEEKGRYSAMDFPYAPTALVLAIRAESEKASRRMSTPAAPQFCRTSPAALLPFLTL